MRKIKTRALVPKPVVVKGIQLHPSLCVMFTYQNFGSAWLGILRGVMPTMINRTFDSLFNLRGANGELEFENACETIATFWTNRRSMRRYFFNRYFLPRCSGKKGQGRVIRSAMRYARAKLDDIKAHQETFIEYEKAPNYDVTPFVSGRISAERPDADMKDAILAHAFADKSGAKSIDTAADLE